MLKNINTALESDIEAIGITQQIAKYIIDSRNYFNGFANIADLDKLDLTSEEKSLLIQNFLFEPISSVQIKINDATEEDLQSIGIDAEWSKYIIDSRNYKGGFTGKNDLNSLELSPEHIKLLSDNFIFEDLIVIPDEITTDRQKLAQKIFEKMNYGSVTVAFYPAKVKTGGSEHKSQANQFAADHESLCIRNNEISIGSSNEINTVAVWDTLKVITEKAEALLLENSLIQDSGMFKINDVAFLTHGTSDQLQIGVVSGGFNSWIKNSYKDFVSKIAVYLADTTKILLYGCGVAGEENTPDPFAEKIRRELYDNLVKIYGVDKVSVEVWGHKDVGHTTANHRLVQFAGSGNFNGGDSLLDDFAEWMCFKQLAERQIDMNSFQDTAKKKKLMEACYSAAYKFLQAYGPPGTDKDQNNKAYTSPNHPVNTLIREIPYIGIANLWNDITSDVEPDYSYLVITEDTNQRLIKGVKLKRERCRTKYAELGKIFDTIL